MHKARSESRSQMCMFDKRHFDYNLLNSVSDCLGPIATAGEFLDSKRIAGALACGDVQLSHKV